MNDHTFDESDELGAVVLRERMTGAVGDVQPDLVSLVGSGTSAGRQLVRTRRRLAAGGVAVAVLLVAGGVTYGVNPDLLGGKAPAVDGGNVTQLVPATPRGLAAVVMDRTADLGDLIAVGGGIEQAEVIADSPGIVAEVGYQLPGGGKLDLRVVAVPGPINTDENAVCSKDVESVTASCELVELPDGSHGAYYVYREADLDSIGGAGTSSATALALIRGDEEVAVIQTVVNSDALPLDKDDLIALLSDPLIGINTTAAFNEAGEQIVDFLDLPDDPTPSSSDSGEDSSGPASASSTTQAAQPPKGEAD